MNLHQRIVGIFAFLVAVELGFGSIQTHAAESPAEPPAVRPPPPPPPGRPQAPRFPNNPPGRGGFGLGGGMGGGGMGFERVLTEEQREQLRDELQSQRGRFRELDERSLRLRREFQEALLAETLDESLVREKAVAMGLVDAERALIRARAFEKLRPSLSPEQLAQLKALSAELPRVGGGPGGEPRLERPGPRRPPEQEADGVEPLPRPRPPAPPPAR